MWHTPAYGARMTESPAPPARTSLSREDWLSAAHAALLAEGPAGLRVEAIARALGATKGSFYWHFKDLADLSGALIDALGDRLSAADAATATLPVRRRVIALALDPDAQGDGAALREWALRDDRARDALARQDAARLATLTAALEESGLGAAAAARGARILIAARIGMGRVTQAEDDPAARILRHLARVVIDGGL